MSKDPDIDIRVYREGDEIQILQLLEQVFHGWPKTYTNASSLVYWLWKYPSQPQFRNEIGLAVDQDKIVGCNHAMYFTLLYDGEECLGRQGCDLAVHVDYRERGLYLGINLLRVRLRTENTRAEWKEAGIPGFSYLSILFGIIVIMATMRTDNKITIYD